MPSTVGRHAAWLTLLAAAALTLSGCGLLGFGGTRATSTETDAPGDTVDIFSIEVGDCLSTDPAGADGISEAGVVDCAEPHVAEVYASSTVPDGAFPGDAAILEQAGIDCSAEFTEFVGTPFTESELGLRYLNPTRSSWNKGDRTILCLVMDPSGSNTGSLEGAKR